MKYYMYGACGSAYCKEIEVDRKGRPIDPKERGKTPCSDCVKMGGDRPTPKKAN